MCKPPKTFTGTSDANFIYFQSREREGKNEILISRLLFTQELVSSADDYLLSVLVYHFFNCIFFLREFAKKFAIGNLFYDTVTSNHMDISI